MVRNGDTKKRKEWGGGGGLDLQLEVEDRTGVDQQCPECEMDSRDTARWGGGSVAPKERREYRATHALEGNQMGTDTGGPREEADTVQPVLPGPRGDIRAWIGCRCRCRTGG